MWADNGAYTGKSQAILGAASVRHDALYKYPCARGNSTLVYTNLVPTGAFRGFGNPSADWAVEQAWDLAAEKLGHRRPRPPAHERGGPGRPFAAQPQDHELRAEAVHRQGRRADRLAGEAQGSHSRTNDPHAGSRNPLAGWAWAAACTSTAGAASATGTAAPRSCASTRTAAPRSSPAKARSARAISRCCARSRRRSWDCPTSTWTSRAPTPTCIPHSLGALASRLTYVAGNAVKNAAAAAAAAAHRGRGRAVQAPRVRAHDHQRRDRAAQRRRDRVQAGRRRRAREHLSARRPADRRRGQFRQSVGVSGPQPLRQRVGRLQLHRAGGGGRSRPRHGRGEAARDRRPPWTAAP